MKIAQMKVDLVDHMGTDLTVVNAARVSFDKASDWKLDFSKDHKFGDNVLSDADTKLIHYLAKHNHWSPFAHTSIQLRIKAPIFVARQLAKHQIGASWNEVSRRYVDSEPEFFFPEVWRGRPTDGMKQGSSGIVERLEADLDVTPGDEARKACFEAYCAHTNLLEAGVAPEQARMVLPQNMMTEWYWTGSLMFFARVCAQRLDPHAQAETFEVARQIDDIVQPLFPVSWAALTEPSK